MKWLILQTNGEHQGQDSFCRNDYLRECFALKHAIEKNGHEVEIYGPGHLNYAPFGSLGAWHDYVNTFDVLFLIEQYNYAWLLPWDNTRPLKMQWIIDLHCGNTERYLHYSSMCDIVLHSTRELLLPYKALCSTKKHLWFPNGVDTRFFHRGRPDVEKKHDAIFVGTDHPKRRNFMDGLGDSVTRFFATGYDMINLILSARIHVNKPIANDINYRCFETIGLGTPLLTEYQPDLLKLGFAPDVNCAVYTGVEDCKRKIKELLASTTQMNYLTSNSNKLAEQNSYINRIKTLLTQI